MGKEADPSQESSATEKEHAEQAAAGEAMGTPDSGRNQSETAVHQQEGNKEAKP